MNAINRIAHLFPVDRSTLYRDFHAHVDGFVVLEQTEDDAADETSARVEVFEVEAAKSTERDDPTRMLDQIDRRLAASMIPVRGGQRFRVWNSRNMPVTLCFLPTERPDQYVSLNLFSPQ